MLQSMLQGSALQRVSGSAVLAVGVTFALLYLMYYLSFLRADYEESNIQGARIDFVRAKEDSQVRERERRPEPVKQQTTPPTPKVNMSANRPDLGSLGGPVIGIPAREIAGASIGGAMSDMDAVPLVRIQPEYPRRAAQLNIKGWVLLEFTVTTAGTTKDVRVVDSEPPRTFDRAAVRAAQKFKYRPKVVDGAPVEQYGVQLVLRFDGVTEE